LFSNVLMIVSPVTGFEEIANPFIAQEEENDE
jgi:hypothetical protein